MAQGHAGRQGGVAAQRYFPAGGEPAQHPAAVIAPEKRRFRLVEAGGQALQNGIR